MNAPLEDPAAARVDAVELLELIFTTSPDAIVVVDATGTIVLSNPAVLSLFGYRPDELVGTSISKLLPLDRRADHEGHLRAYFRHPRARMMGVGQRLVGQRRDGDHFPVDVALAPVEVRGVEYAAAFVRDAVEQHRELNRLHAVNEISQHLLAGAAPDSVFPLIASSARALSRSDAAWIVLPSGGGDLEIAHVDGPGTEVLVGQVLSAESSRSAGVMKSGASQGIDDLSTATNVPPQCAELDLGAGLYVPLVAEGRPLGALVFGRRHGNAAYTALDVAFAEVFASSTAATILLGQSRDELDRLRIVEEDERIARDLHDTVIQQLFALGMSLQATRSRIEGAVAERIDEAVDHLDRVIRDIRTTIFRLPAQAHGEGGFRQSVLECVGRAHAQLGFSPRVAFDGPVETAVSPGLASEILIVLHEALSNVARHAEATSADVIVSVGGGVLELIVADDGRGVDASPTAGSGMRNMRTRAEVLGGEAVCRAREPRGTVLEWRVPL